MQRLRVSKRWDRQASTSLLSVTSARNEGDVRFGVGSTAISIDNQPVKAKA